jgi:hypothetical protein
VEVEFSPEKGREKGREKSEKFWFLAKINK